MTFTIWLIFPDKRFCGRLSAGIRRALPGSSLCPFSTADDGIRFLDAHPTADLILADPFADPAVWPLLESLRRNAQTDLIILTKDRSPASLALALQSGAWDFLLLPVTSKRLTQSLARYRSIRGSLAGRGRLTQPFIDHCLSFRAPDSLPSAAFTDFEAKKLLSCLASLGPEGADAVTLSRLLGCSPGAVRTKAEALVQQKKLGRRPNLCGKKGRPRTLYYLINGSLPV